MTAPPASPSLPSLFVSHGPPTIAVADCPARDFLAGLGAAIPRPRAILCVSAHWETPAPAVSGAVRPETVYDFYGFPDALYRMTYPAPGAPEVAGQVAELLAEAGLEGTVDPGQGLDHGAWIPLMLIYPDADIPVAQVAVQPGRDTRHHFELGCALSPLRQDGVLILGSGNATHNLRDFRRHGFDDPPVAYAAAFEDWLDDRLAAGDAAAVIDYRTRGPEAARNHPSEEHFLPLLVALGAGGAATAQRLHLSYLHGVLSMSAYAFG